MSWLDRYFKTGIQQAGQPVASAVNINFTNANATLNPATGAVDVTTTGGGGFELVSSEHIAAGIVVCSASGNGAQVATPSRLLNGSTIVGFAIADIPISTALDASHMAPLGAQVPSSVHHLTPGTSGRVGVDALGAPFFVAPKNAGSGFEVGAISSSNVMTIDPASPGAIAPPNYFSLATYGGRSGSTAAERWSHALNNDAAYLALLDAVFPDPGLGPIGTDHRWHVDAPYCFTKGLEQSRTLLITGTNATGRSTGCLIFPTGVYGIHPIFSVPGSNLQALFSQIANLDTAAQMPPIVADRTNNLSVTASTFYTLAGETRYYLLAETSGTTSGSFPAAITVGGGSYAPLSGDTVIDGGVTWRWMARAYETVRVFEPSTTVAKGDQFRPFGDGRFVYTALDAGVSNSTTGEPEHVHDSEGGYTSASHIVRDVTAAPVISYRVETHSAVKMDVFTHIFNFTPGGRWSNCGVFAFGQLPDTDVNNCVIQNVTPTNSGEHFQGCAPGMGVYLAGTDANGTNVSFLNASGLGVVQDGTIGVAGWSRAEGYARWWGNYTQNGNGPGFISQNIQGGYWASNRNEGYLPNVMTNTPHCVDTESTFGSDCVVLPSAAGPGQNITTADRTGVPNSYTQTDAMNGSNAHYGLRTDDDSAAMVWQYNPTRFAWELGTPNSPKGHGAFDIGASRAVDGPGWMWLRDTGFFAGESNKIFVGLDSGMRTSKFIDGGRRRVGDRFLRSNYPSPGSYAWDVIRTAGLDGPRWVMGMTQEVARFYGTNGRVFATTVASNNVGGWVHLLTKPGTQGGSEPSWSTTIDADAPQVWVASTPLHDDEYFRPTVLNGHKYRPKPGFKNISGTWQVAAPYASDTRYYAYDIVTVNGRPFYLQAYRAEPMGGGNINVGAMVTPSSTTDPAFKRFFSVIAVTDGHGTIVTRNDGAFATTGVEPTWPLDGSPIECGTALFQEVAFKSNQTPPMFSTDAGTAPLQIDGMARADHKHRVFSFWVPYIPTTSGVDGSATWGTGTGSITPELATSLSPPVGLPIPHPGDPGFGLVWVESGTFNAAAITVDGTAEWCCAGFQVEIAQEGLVRQGGVYPYASGAAPLFAIFSDTLRVTTGPTIDLSAGASCEGVTITVFNDTGADLTVDPGGHTLPIATPTQDFFFYSGVLRPKGLPA